MNRRTTLLLAVITLIGLPALPQLGFAQSDPFIGIWQLNVAKSKYSPGPPPKSQTMYLWEDEGKNRKNSQVTISADGVPNAVVIIHNYDDNPRPVPGQRTYDASAYTRIDAHTINARYLKDGKVVYTGTWVVSPDSKTLMATYTGPNASGQQVDELRIYEKQ